MNTGYIYIIKSKKVDDVYIGSTKHTMLKRFKQHEYDFDTGKKICSSMNIIKYGDAYCELLENVKYDDINELRNKEKDIIQSKKYKCVNTKWNTSEENDTIEDDKTEKRKQLKEQELKEKKEQSEKILNYFEIDKLYNYDEFRDILKTMKIFDDYIKDKKNKEVMGKINCSLKTINKRILSLQIGKRWDNKKRVNNLKYKMVEL
jgi:hypothetical protein